MTISIEHTAEDGTVICGDIRPHHGLVKQPAGPFRYSRNVGWYIPGSRGALPRTIAIEGAAVALRGAGLDVTVTIEQGTVEERAAAKIAAVEQRQGALDAKAERRTVQGEASIGRAREIGSHIPFGQPILVGHHSEGRHRRDLARINRGYDKGYEALSEATEAQRKAEASRADQSYKATGPAILRRIGRLEVEARDLARKLGDAPKTPQMLADEKACGITLGAPATGRWRGQLLERQAILTEQLDFERKRLAESGHVLLGKADFKKGDVVRVRYGGARAVKVERVNAKSLSVRIDGRSWTDTIPYCDVLGKISSTTLEGPTL